MRFLQHVSHLKSKDNRKGVSMHYISAFYIAVADTRMHHSLFQPFDPRHVWTKVGNWPSWFAGLQRRSSRFDSWFEISHFYVRLEAARNVSLHISSFHRSSWTIGRRRTTLTFIFECLRRVYADLKREIRFLWNRVYMYINYLLHQPLIRIRVMLISA